MGFGGGPSPPPIPLPPAAAHPPTLGKDSVALAGTSAAQRAAAAGGSGLDGTIFTSPQGLKKTATTAKNTLLG